jgi:hypothetical protein
VGSSHQICDQAGVSSPPTIGRFGFRSIAASFHAAYAVTDASVLFNWGCESYAHDGEFPITHGPCRVRLSPWRVAALHGITVVGVSAGMRHALALAADGPQLRQQSPAREMRTFV